MVKIVNLIDCSGNYVFGGWDNIFLEVTKEDNNSIEGLEILKHRGNAYPYSDYETGNKLIINRNNPNLIIEVVKDK